MLPWIGGLLLLTVFSFASLFVRYRNAGAIERAQIKWLLYASGLFAAVYFSTVNLYLFNAKLAQGIIFSSLLPISLLGIPISIAIAILRYRLWDIDVIIRKTFTFGVLTITLGLVFFGGVALLQQMFGRLCGVENSPIAIVVSTLAIAALFNPLRISIQKSIDRGFYRRKYNAQQTLEIFARSARNETDLDNLTAELVRVAKETMQPESISLWLRPSLDRSVRTNT